MVNSEKEENDNDNKTTSIVVSVVCAVVVAAGIGVVIYFLVKNMKAKVANTINDSNKVFAQNKPKTNNDMVEGSIENRIIEFKN